jgi:hypothetical protein
MTPTDRYLNEHRVRMARAARKRDRRMRRIARRWKGVNWHKGHQAFVPRRKHEQVTYKEAETRNVLHAAYLHDLLVVRLTGGRCADSELNFPHLFPPLEAAS